MMSVLVTGAAGGIGRAAVRHLEACGHEVRATDRVVADGVDVAELTDPNQAQALVDGIDAVVHAAAIPQPFLDPDETVFANNTQSCFVVAAAARRAGIKRFVYLSSETVAGYTFGSREPAYVQVDEEHPVGSDDPYGLSKLLGETIMDGLALRGVTCLSLRPSWVHGPAEYAKYWEWRDQYVASKSIWAYTDLDDLCEAIAAAVIADVVGHERLYVVADDNILGADLESLVHDRWEGRVPVRNLPRADAGGVSWRRAREILGYAPRRSFRDAVPPAPTGQSE